jgi:hypothetical protein
MRGARSLQHEPIPDLEQRLDVLRTVHASGWERKVPLLEGIVEVAEGDYETGGVEPNTHPKPRELRVNDEASR